MINTQPQELATIKLNNKERILFLSGAVNSGSVNSIIENIIKLNIEDENLENYLREYVRNPIKLYINSPGGSVYDGFGLMDIMDHSKTPIHTYVVGKCMSMGFGIFIAGHKRYCYNNSSFMYHEISSFVWDKIEGIKQGLKEAERLQEIYDDVVLKKTKIKKDKLDKVKVRKAEWYIAPKEAITLGIADEIL